MTSKCQLDRSIAMASSSPPSDRLIQKYTPPPPTPIAFCLVLAGRQSKEGTGFTSGCFRSLTTCTHRDEQTDQSNYQKLVCNQILFSVPIGFSHLISRPTSSFPSPFLNRARALPQKGAFDVSRLFTNERTKGNRFLT